MKFQCWIASPILLAAAPAALAQAVSYEEALRDAQTDQPMLEARASQVAGARETAGAANELPDPQLRGGVANFPISGPEAFEFGRQMGTGIMVNVEQPIPNLAKRRALAGVAKSNIGVAQARLGEMERNIRLATGTAWLSLAYAQRRHSVARQARNSLDPLVPIGLAAVSSGAARPAESLEIRRALLEIEDAITRIEAERTSAQARLARFIAVDVPVAVGDSPSLMVDPDGLRAALIGVPEIKVAEAISKRAATVVSLAEAEKRPDFGISVGYERRGSSFGDSVSVLGSISLPLFSGRRQEPRIRAAEAEELAALNEQRDILREVEARFAADLADWHSAKTQWDRARAELLPLARERAELETVSFSAGRADLIDVIAARTALALLEIEILTREEAVAQAAAKLRLTYGGQIQ